MIAEMINKGYRVYPIKLSRFKGKEIVSFVEYPNLIFVKDKKCRR